MSRTVEQEFKVLLTKAQAEALQAAYPFGPAVTQRNDYYDTATHTLRRLGVGLRIRRLDNHSEQTLKVPDGPNRRLLELTDPLSEPTGLQAGGVVAAWLSAHHLPLAQLTRFSWATTKRAVVQLPAGTLTLDVTDYPNGTRDYELELEYQDFAVATDFFTAVRQDFGLSHQPAVNKVARAAANTPDA